VDVDGFRDEMARHREISRSGGDRAHAQRAAAFAAEAGFVTEFVGYEKLDVLTQLGALEEVEGGLFLAKLRESPFYPDGGGQVTDAGWIEKDGARAELVGAFRLGDDQALLLEGEGFAAGDRVRAVVPWRVRFPTMANHTATHLLHKALQDVLGDHVRQAGSAVRPDKLRFDFTHPQALTAEERERVEEVVNERVFENLPVRALLTTLDEARTLGAMMLFGEKYGDVVRLVEVDGYSRELCGGTHVRTTAEIGPFAILSEGSVGSGVRRIEAVTSGEAFAYLRSRAQEAEELRQALEQARREGRRSSRESPAHAVVDEREHEVDGVRLYLAELENADAETLLEVSDREKQRRSPAAVVLGAREDGRVHLVVNVDPAVVDRGVDASAVVRAAAALVGGGGGGRPTMARAGGRNPEKLGDALDEAEKVLLAALG
jgi:alanyl-tRNA synthetase